MKRLYLTVEGQTEAEFAVSVLTPHLADFDSRFLPYIQVHEFEALVLCDPRRIKTLYEVRDADLDELCEECQGFGSPEEIDHGPHSHPKYRIRGKVPAYDENVAGPLLAGSVGLDVLRARCLHFGDWLGRLERLDVA